ncbi:hypothetical protein [Aquimonas voraii]|uniref:Uncharacterized protein n=1 Tax=Aquimonas voraii TaxID=265719 RepID=A0A1G6WJL3_9GAMM|nr:hypothetical protein [Aquimonas voraii]SDD65437.1 hypothetical protein SAMN04488509_1056 [Aquimonas voraii]
MSPARIPACRRLHALASTALLAAVLPLSASAQSAASRASVRVSESVFVLPRASVHLLSAGGEFSVAALRPVGDSVEVVLLGAADGARLSFTVGRTALEASGVAVGVSLYASAVVGGHLLWSGSEAVAFVADESLAPHVHRTELRR